MMAITPIDGAALMPSDLFVAWKDDVASVRNFYRERKYRRCTVLCSDLLPKAVHPVFRTFLFFYLAVCYESLGHISHSYSGNKIPLFEQARDAFIAASETLSLPILTTPDGRYDTPGPSPVCPTFDVPELYSPSMYSTILEADQTLRRVQDKTAANSTMTDSADQVSLAYTAPDIGDSSPLQAMPEASPSRRNFEENIGQGNKQPFLTSRQRAASDHKARLSRSLSSQHALAEYLIPSPLFKRPIPSKRESQSEAMADGANPLPLVTLSKPLPPTPVNRPLPALPFNHQPHFMLKGKRYVIAPRRQTALATLISRFEGRTPFDSPSPAESNGKEMVHVELTPTTLRFKCISATFVKKEDVEATPERRALGELKSLNQKSHQRQPKDSTVNNLHSPYTPCPKPQHKLQMLRPTPFSQYPILPSTPTDSYSPQSPATHLFSYKNHLSSFQTTIKCHITAIITHINQTHAVQVAHEDEKRQRFANMHSRHSSALEPTSPSKSSPGNRGRNSKSLPTKDMRLRSFWSLQMKDAQVKTPGMEEEKARERKERIERLKADGWRGVSKEVKGWKGASYYEGLRRRADEEMRLGLECC